MSLARKTLYGFIVFLLAALIIGPAIMPVETLMSATFAAYIITVPAIFVDAKQHGRRGTLWAIGALLFAVLVVPAYLWVTA